MKENNFSKYVVIFILLLLLFRPAFVFTIFIIYIVYKFFVPENIKNELKSKIIENENNLSSNNSNVRNSSNNNIYKTNVEKNRYLNNNSNVHVDEEFDKAIYENHKKIKNSKDAIKYAFGEKSDKAIKIRNKFDFSEFAIKYSQNEEKEDDPIKRF